MRRLRIGDAPFDAPRRPNVYMRRLADFVHNFRYSPRACEGARPSIDVAAAYPESPKDGEKPGEHDKQTKAP